VDQFKIIVFFVTARLTQMSADLFRKLKMPVLEIHSRKSQNARTKVSNKFRTGSNMILFTSDVSARGMDYPDISMVVQVGLPTNKEQYVHRIGRTARAGKGGCGVLLLSNLEHKNFMSQCQDQKMITRDPKCDEPGLQAAIDEAVQKVQPKFIAMAMHSWLGFYKSHLKKTKWSKTDLVLYGNRLAVQGLLQECPPPMPKKTVRKMGMVNVTGLWFIGKNGSAQVYGNPTGMEKRESAVKEEKVDGGSQTSTQRKPPMSRSLEEMMEEDSSLKFGQSKSQSSNRRRSRGRGRGRGRKPPMRRGMSSLFPPM